MMGEFRVPSKSNGQKSLLPLEVKYSQIMGISRWTSWEGHYSVYLREDPVREAVVLDSSA